MYTMEKLEKLLPQNQFVRCHAGYIVNCFYVFSINPNEILLTTGERIPLSRHRKKEMKSVFQQYLRGIWNGVILSGVWSGSNRLWSGHDAVFVSKFLGCRYQGWQNRIFQFLSFFVIFNYMMIVDKIFLPYNAVKDFVVMLLYILYALLLTKGARRYQHFCTWDHICYVSLKGRAVAGGTE